MTIIRPIPYIGSNFLALLQYAHAHRHPIGWGWQTWLLMRPTSKPSSYPLQLNLWRDAA